MGGLIVKHTDYEEVDFAHLRHDNDDEASLFFIGVGFAAIGVLILGVGLGAGYALGVFLG